MQTLVSNKDEREVVNKRITISQKEEEFIPDAPDIPYLLMDVEEQVREIEEKNKNLFSMNEEGKSREKESLLP